MIPGTVAVGGHGHPILLLHVCSLQLLSNLVELLFDLMGVCLHCEIRARLSKNVWDSGT